MSMTDYYSGLSEEDVARKRRQADAMFAQGTSAAPVGHWTQALARIAQAVSGGMLGAEASAGEKAGRQSIADALMGGGTAQEKMAALSRTPWGQGMASKLSMGTLQSELADQTERGKLSLDELRTKVDAAKRNQRIDEDILRGVGLLPPAPGVAASPAPPTPNAAPGGTLPQVPGISVAPPSGLQAPPAAAPPQSGSPAANILSGRSPEELRAWGLLYRKDPKKAAEQLLEWANPNKEQEKARQKELGEAQGKAQAGLPKAIGDADALLKRIDDALYAPDPKNPGKYLTDPKTGQPKPNKNLAAVVGPWDGSSWVPTIRGSSVDMQERLKQIGGAAFLQAYESLRGAGSISASEATPATAALGRIANLRQSEAGYREALRDFRNEVVRLKKLAEDRATGRVPAAPQEAPDPNATNIPRKAPDGNWYLPDPNRPGKYLRVDQ